MNRKWAKLTKEERKLLRGERNLLRAVVRNLKRVPCKDCGVEYPPESMDFDHVPGRGGKLGRISQMQSERGIINEARKCDVVCSNCHRIRTRRRRRDQKFASRERRRWLEGLNEAIERERMAIKEAKQGIGVVSLEAL